jgi:hypothetical protein
MKPPKLTRLALDDIGSGIVIAITAIFALIIGVYLVIVLAPSVGQLSGGFVEDLFVLGTVGMVFAVVVAYVLGRGNN